MAPYSEPATVSVRSPVGDLFNLYSDTLMHYKIIKNNSWRCAVHIRVSYGILSETRTLMAFMKALPRWSKAIPIWCKIPRRHDPIGIVNESQSSILDCSPIAESEKFMARYYMSISINSEQVSSLKNSIGRHLLHQGHFHTIRRQYASLEKNWHGII